MHLPSEDGVFQAAAFVKGSELFPLSINRRQVSAQPAPPTGSWGWSRDSSSAHARGTQGTLWALFSPGMVRPAREDGHGRGQRARGPRAILH